MKLRAEDIQAHVKNPLAAIYIVSGDEPLQVNEITDTLRDTARQQQFNERHVMHIDKSFDWQQFYSVANSFSLFADRQLIELRMPGGKPGDKGAKALLEYAGNPAPDSVLIIIAGKLDKSVQRSKWFAACEKAGVFIQVWPVESNQLGAWLQRRIRAKGMQVSREAVQMLVERVEGNLLAAAQEIDKLYLLFGSTPIDEEALIAAVSDSARYDIYGFVDTVLIGEKARVSKMLSGLKSEGVEPVLVLWALTREIRALNQLSLHMGRGVKVEQVVAQARVWPKRKFAVTAGLRRHNTSSWQSMLAHAARIDRIIKGMAVGNVWNELLQLTLYIAGTRLFEYPGRFGTDSELNREQDLVI